MALMLSNEGIVEAIATCNLFEMFAPQTFQHLGQGTSVPCAGEGARSPFERARSPFISRPLRKLQAKNF
jgi:hypothetical protein